MKTIKILPIAIVIFAQLFVCQSLQAQNDSVSNRKLWREAEKHVMYNQFEAALKNYLLIFKTDPDNRHLQFKIGYCYIQEERCQNIDFAIEYLLLAANDIDNKYYNSYRERSAPVETKYFLGVAYRLKKDYKTAIDYYTEFKKEIKHAKMYIVTEQQVEFEIKACNEAMNEFKSPIRVPYDFIMKNRQLDLNVRCPVFAYEVGLLFYTLGASNVFPPDVNYDREYNDSLLDSIYYSKQITFNTWSEPVVISDRFKLKNPAQLTSVSPDATKLYIVIDINDNGDIYVSELRDSVYSKPKKLNSNINTKKWESFATVTADGSRLYFTSMRKGGFGGMDIYYSELDKHGKWGPAVNLGPTINTVGYEEMPYISRDGTELYFSSEGHTTKGGFDVFYSKLDTASGKWSEPENVGYPFNTDGNDMGYIVEFNGDVSFCPVNSSKRRGGYEECDCIRIKLGQGAPLITCKVVNDNTIPEFPDDVMLFVINDATKDTVGTYNISESKDHTALFILPQGKYNLYTQSDEALPTLTVLEIPERTGPIDTTIVISSPQAPQAPVVCVVKHDNTLPKLPNDVMLYVINDNTKETIGTYNVTDRKNSVTLPLPPGDYTFRAESDSAYPASKSLHVPETHDTLTVVVTISAPSDKYLQITWVQFDFDKSDIKPEYYANLDSLADYMKRYPNAVIYVNGHCDPFGTNEYNIALGDRRANSVKTYLVSKGVNPDNLITKSFGEEELIARGESAEARVYDRRVEFIVKQQGDVELRVVPKNPPAKYALDGKGEEPQNIQEPQQGTVKEPIVADPPKGTEQKVVVTWVQFDFDKSDIKPESYENLDSLADYLVTYPEAKVYVHGHCDPFGTNAYNIALGDRRANSVKNYLTSKGVNSNQLLTDTYGEERLIAKGESAEARVYDRRVEFIVIKQGGIDLIVVPKLPPAKYALDGQSYSQDNNTVPPASNQPVNTNTTETAPADSEFGTVNPDIILEITWVLFDFDKSNIKPEFYANLDSLADYLKKYPEARIYVHGHCDPFGSNAYNIALGQRRANSVSAYLINKGVKSEQLVPETFGEERLNAKGESAEARIYDRRVEFIVIKQGGITLKVIPRKPPAKYAID